MPKNKKAFLRFPVVNLGAEHLVMGYHPHIAWEPVKVQGKSRYATDSRRLIDDKGFEQVARASAQA